MINSKLQDSHRHRRDQAEAGIHTVHTHTHNPPNHPDWLPPAQPAVIACSSIQYTHSSMLHELPISPKRRQVHGPMTSLAVRPTGRARGGELVWRALSVGRSVLSLHSTVRTASLK